MVGNKLLIWRLVPEFLGKEVGTSREGTVFVQENTLRATLNEKGRPRRHNLKKGDEETKQFCINQSRKINEIKSGESRNSKHEDTKLLDSIKNQKLLEAHSYCQSMDKVS